MLLGWGGEQRSAGSDSDTDNVRRRGLVKRNVIKIEEDLWPDPRQIMHPQEERYVFGGESHYLYFSCIGLIFSGN